MVELVDHTGDGRRSVARRSTAHTVYYTSVDRNALTSICCAFVYITRFYSCAVVDKISTDIARRAVPLRDST